MKPSFRHALLSAFLLFTFGATAQLPSPCPSNFTPPADNCFDACTYCNFSGITSNTFMYTSGPASGFCGTLESEQWLGFVASASAATFIATPTSCSDGNGVQIAVYETCSGDPIACYGGQSGGASIPASVTVSMTPGQNYFMLIDGFAGDQCNFTITVDPPSAVSAGPIGQIGQISGPDMICAGGTAIFSVPPVSNVGAYTWTAPPGSYINGQDPPVTIPVWVGGNEVTVTFGSTGGQVCVQASNACMNGPQACKSVALFQIPPTNLPPVRICREDAPYTLPWGVDVSNSGTYSQTLSTVFGCDSVVRQQVTVLPPIIKVLPQAVICGKDSFVVCGQTIDQSGPYSVMCTSSFGCDSMVTGQLTVVGVVADILNTSNVGCGPTLVLRSAATAGQRKWLDGTTGQVLGIAQNLTISQAGTYVLSVTGSSGGFTCTDTDTIVITAMNAAPSVAATGGQITCASTSVTLDATFSGATNPVFFWSGPNGYNSDEPTPTVSAPGAYRVTITDPNTGCTAKDNTIVTTAAGVPRIVFDAPFGDTLNCYNPGLDLLLTVTGATDFDLAWEGDGTFSASFDYAFIESAGTYTVTVTNLETNCTGFGLYTIYANQIAPEVLLSEGEVSCSNPLDTIFAQVTANSNQLDFFWDGPSVYPNGDYAEVDFPGDYFLVVTDLYNGCYTEAATVVNEVPGSYPATAEAAFTLTCLDVETPLFVYTDGNFSEIEWTGPGGFFSNDFEPIVTEPGTYNVTLTESLCTATATVEVLQDTLAPVPVFGTPGVLDCANDMVELTVSTDLPDAELVWYFGGDAIDFGPSIFVSEGGTYRVEATNPYNGCTSSAELTVLQDLSVPSVVLFGGGLLPCNSFATLSAAFTGGSQPLVYQWLDPTGNLIALNQLSISVAEPGVYTFTTTGANACVTEASIEVVDDCNCSYAGTIFGFGPLFGQSNDVSPDTIYLCFGDSLLVNHNGDAAFAGDPNPITEPGVGYGFYECPPTVVGPTFGDILGDPCVVDNPMPTNGLWVATGEQDGDIWLGNANIVQTFFAMGDPVLLWFAPITFDDFASNSFETGSCVNVSTDEAFAVVYLNEIIVENLTLPSSSQLCKGSFRVEGGLPEFDNGTRYEIKIAKTTDPTVQAQLNTPPGGFAHGDLVEFTATQTGLYNVSIEDGKSCGRLFQIDLTQCQTSSTQPAPGDAAQQVRVFPNPAAETLHVETNFQYKEGIFRLYDLRGGLVRSFASAASGLDLRGLPTGLYTLQCWLDGAVFSEKLEIGF